MQDKKLNIYKDFISKIKNHLKIYTDDALAKKLKVSPSAVAQWYKRGVPQRFMIEYDQIISGVGEKVVVEDKQIHINKGEQQVDASYIIDLQKDKIQSQEKQIKTLKNALKEKQAESTHWEQLEYDFKCNVTLIRKGWKFGRVMDSVTNLERQSRILGYTTSEIEKFWAVGVKHDNFEDHPVAQIITKEYNEQLKKSMSTLPILFDAINTIVGDHYIPQPIVYIHKKGHSVGAISYNKVEWKKMKVTSKVQFLND